MSYTALIVRFSASCGTPTHCSRTISTVSNVVSRTLKTSFCVLVLCSEHHNFCTNNRDEFLRACSLLRAPQLTSFCVLVLCSEHHNFCTNNRTTSPHIPATILSYPALRPVNHHHRTASQKSSTTSSNDKLHHRYTASQFDADIRPRRSCRRRA